MHFHLFDQLRAARLGARRVSKRVSGEVVKDDARLLLQRNLAAPASHESHWGQAPDAG